MYATHPDAAPAPDARPDKNDSAPLGFLSVVEDEQLGAFGGLLLVDHWARPIEFHCTTPVKPTRAQEILYGATLRPHVLGELIGGTLAAQCSMRPAVLFVDHRDLLAAGRTAQIPAAFAAAGDEPVWDAESSAAHEAVRRCAARLDLEEPFERVRQALAEVLQLDGARSRSAAA